MNTQSPPWSAACPLCSHPPAERRLKDLSAFECPSCGFLWLRSRPPPSAYETTNVDFSPEKLSLRMRNCRHRVALISRVIPLDRTCDIGCGEGAFLAALRERDFSSPMGVEPNAACVSFGQRIGLNVLQGTLEDCPRIFSAFQPNVVTLFHVVEHLVDPFEALKMLRRSLRPGSFLVIETPNIRSYSARRWGDRWRFIYHQHLSYFTPSTLRLSLQQAGFTVVAEGVTDFDRYALPWGELLIRLGLRNIPAPAPLRAAEGTPGASAVNKQGTVVRSVLKSGVRNLLSRLVGLLRRRDYIWVIAKVP
ncbi:MAG: methyltransferase domain-containing protein [Candidatus Peregrinibacteria bacterium]